MRKILLIDNDPCLLELLTLELEQAGYRVQSYTSAEDALRAKLELLDLAILDYRLPRMDGLTLLVKLRHYYPALPAIIISSEHRLGAVPSGTGSPTTRVLRKPFSLGTFIESVTSLVQEQANA